MNVAHWMSLLHEHNELVFGITAAAFLLVVAVLFYRSLAADGANSSSMGAADLGNLEDTLKRVLAQTPVTTVATSGVVDREDAGASSGAPGEEVFQLTQSVMERDKRIAALQQEIETAKADFAAKQLDTSAGGGGGAPSPELESKIKDLEARLAEYEIIEDDIADLSMYKDENERLKKELEQFKAGGAAPIRAAEPAPDGDVMREFASAVEDKAPPSPERASGVDLAQMAGELPPTPDAAEIAASNAAAEADAALAALQAEMGVSGLNIASEAPAAVEVPASVEMPAPVEIPEPVSVAVEDTSSTAAAPPASLSEESPLGGNLDTDKMLAEVADLEQAGTAETGAALEESLDTDKLLAEVGSMDNALSAAPTPAPTPAAAAAVASAPAPAPPIDIGLGAPPETDDLLGEFSEPKKGNG